MDNAQLEKELKKLKDIYDADEEYNRRRSELLEQAGTSSQCNPPHSATKGVTEDPQSNATTTTPTSNDSYSNPYSYTAPSSYISNDSSYNSYATPSSHSYGYDSNSSYSTPSVYEPPSHSYDAPSYTSYSHAYSTPVSEPTHSYDAPSYSSYGHSYSTPVSEPSSSYSYNSSSYSNYSSENKYETPSTITPSSKDSRSKPTWNTLAELVLADLSPKVEVDVTRIKRVETSYTPSFETEDKNSITVYYRTLHGTYKQTFDADNVTSGSIGSSFGVTYYTLECRATNTIYQWNDRIPPGVYILRELKYKTFRGKWNADIVGKGEFQRAEYRYNWAEALDSYGDRRVARFLKTYKRDWSQGLPTGYDVLRAFKGVGFANPLPPPKWNGQVPEKFYSDDSINTNLHLAIRLRFLAHNKGLTFDQFAKQMNELLQDDQVIIVEVQLFAQCQQLGASLKSKESKRLENPLKTPYSEKSVLVNLNWSTTTAIKEEKRQFSYDSSKQPIGYLPKSEAQLSTFASGTVKELYKTLASLKH